MENSEEKISGSFSSRKNSVLIILIELFVNFFFTGVPDFCER